MPRLKSARPQAIIVAVRLLAILLVASGLALTPVGWARSSAGPVYSARDLPAILAPKPPLPPAGPLGPYIDDTVNQGGPVFPLDELDKPTARTFRAAGFQVARRKAWKEDSSGNSIFSLAVTFLFRDAPGARTVFVAVRKSLGTTVEPARIGNGAFVSHNRRNDGEIVNYVWRRSNLMILSHMECEDEACNFDVIRAARAYVNVIDARAKRKT